jgi:hypothetical protein
VSFTSKSISYSFVGFCGSDFWPGSSFSASFFAGAVVHRRLAVLVDRGARFAAFLRGLAAKQIEHPSEHALELDGRFVACFHVSVGGGGRKRHERQRNHRDSGQAFHSVSLH